MQYIEKLALNVTETATVLGVSRPTVYQLCRRSDFPSFRIGGRTLISKRRLDEWVQNQAEGKT